LFQERLKAHFCKMGLGLAATLREAGSTSLPSLKAMARQPSNLISYSHSPSGSLSTGSAFIGSIKKALFEHLLALKELVPSTIEEQICHRRSRLGKQQLRAEPVFHVWSSFLKT